MTLPTPQSSCVSWKPAPAIPEASLDPMINLFLLNLLTFLHLQCHYHGPSYYQVFKRSLGSTLAIFHSSLHTAIQINTFKRKLNYITYMFKTLGCLPIALGKMSTFLTKTFKSPCDLFFAHFYRFVTSQNPHLPSLFLSHWWPLQEWHTFSTSMATIEFQWQSWVIER